MYLLKLLAYFVIGFLLDVLGIIDFKATQHNKAFKSAFVSFVGEISFYVVFLYIITTPGNIENPIRAGIEIFCYCLGGAAGVYFTIKMRK